MIDIEIARARANEWLRTIESMRGCRISEPLRTVIYESRVLWEQCEGNPMNDPKFMEQVQTDAAMKALEQFLTIERTP